MAVTLRDDAATAPRFLVVGVTAVLIDAVVYFVVGHWLDAGVAKGISYAAGAAFGYFANWKFTFGARRGVWTEIAFVITYAVSLALNVAINSLVLSLIGGTPGAVLGFVAATGVSTVWNYFGLSRFVFARRRASEEAS